MTITTPLPGPRIFVAQISRLRRVATVLAVAVTLVMSLMSALSAMAGERDRATAPPRPASAQRSPTIVDRAVVPAGGSPCQQCGPGGCRHGHGGASRHHRDCRDGACAPYCPVRPGTFGFYGTQWRRWPGQGVVPVSDERASTPATPPKSEVPGVDEESRGPKPPELPEPATDLGDDAADHAKPPTRPEPEAAPPKEAEPTTEREPAPRQEPPSPAIEEPAADDERSREEPKTPPEPREVPRGEEKPAPAAEPEPPGPRPEDENLFDGSAARKVRRRILVSGGSQPAVSEPAGSVQPAVHRDDQTVESSPPLRRVPLTVPRVPFDPRAELERMRQQR